MHSTNSIRVLTLATALILFGCSARTPTARLKGQVTLDGKPANAGTIIFYGPNNYVASTYIRLDGSYEVGNVPIGEITVTIQSGQPQAKDDPADPGQTRKTPPATAIPKKYASKDSMERIQVTRDEIKNFDLKP